ncbi:MAG: hypothetical protein GVY20_02035 [Bacteroidetes bacterium]|nr:hypothetical protein [Bacteroidota bacterium]
MSIHGFHLLGAMIAADLYDGTDPGVRSKADPSTKVERKECKYSKCDKTHTHNNACCSAEHYWLWQAERKKQD